MTDDEIIEDGPPEAGAGADAANADAEPGIDEAAAEAPVLTDAEGNVIGLDEVDVPALIAERQQFLEAYQRTAADFDNFRKLSQKRLDDEVIRTLGSFVDRLLPVLDAVEAALGHESDDVETVAAALFGFLEREGLERVSPVDEAFDPNVAEAVLHEPGDDEPVVTEVLRTGYLWKGRVIRPAMVKVRG